MKLLKFFKKFKRPNYINCLKIMEHSGYELKTVYDIGAYHGGWSRTLKKFYPSVEIIMFEANPAHSDALSNSGIKFFNVALSNPGRQYVEFFNGQDSGDSYYKETTRHYDHKSSVQVKCHTLDDIVRDNNLAIPNFIKIDTQGSELDILAGASSLLSQVDLCYVECPIIEYNKDAPVISDYLKFFKENNFVPIDIYEVHRSEFILLQIDIMFMRRDVKDFYFGVSEFIRA
jgi:FkbM family methyltransferase